MNATTKQPGRFVNTLYTADNLYVLAGMNSRSVDLIYLDPPFNSKRLYAHPVGLASGKKKLAEFKDIWRWADVDEAYLEELVTNYPALARYISSVGEVHSASMMAYLTYMVQRLIEMHRVLKDSGSLYLHCDPTAGHYLKSLLDGVFGRNSFRNEIVWAYTGPGSPGMRQFNRKHDTIFWYSKSRTQWTFNKDAVRLPYKDPNQSLRRAFDATGEGWTKADLEELRKRGKVPETWWADITPVGRLKRELIGYPTQKPLKLLHRIIKASSNEGDVVLDPFCGCATTCVAAQQLGRKWLGIDIAEPAADILIERLEQDNDKAGWWKEVFVHTTEIPRRTDVRYIAPSLTVKERLYKAQDGICPGCLKRFDIVNMEIDHVRPKARGGGDYYENYQLLCSHCNRLKGDRPMAYLRAKLAARDKMHEQIFFTR